MLAVTLIIRESVVAILLLLGHFTGMAIPIYSDCLMSIFSPSQYLQIYLLGQMGQRIQVSFENNGFK